MASGTGGVSASSTYFSRLLEEIRAAGPEVSPALVDRLIHDIYDRAKVITRNTIHAKPGLTTGGDTTEFLHDGLMNLRERLGKGLGTLPELRRGLHLEFLFAKMVRDLVIDHFRRITGLKYRLQNPSLEVPDDYPASGGQTPDRQALLAMAVHELTDGLDPDDCKLVFLRFYLGMTLEEVADRLRRELTPEEIVARVGQRLANPRSAAKVTEALVRVLTDEEITRLRGGPAAVEVADRLRRTIGDEELAAIVGIDHTTIGVRLGRVLKSLAERARDAGFEPCD